MKQISPMQSMIRAMRTGAETFLKAAAMGALTIRARAVPILAVANCIPMARAISFPLNHLTMALVTVIPATSTPTPKIA